MIILLLGILDLFFSVFMLLAAASWVVKGILLVAGIYFLAKSIIFSIGGINIGSVFDFIASIVIFMSFFTTIHPLLFLISGALVFQKGIFSLF
jgi:hypothetical protein